MAKLKTDLLNSGLSRRSLLQAGAGLAGTAMLPVGFSMPAFAADHAPLGTWPAGTQGADVTIRATVPRTAA